MTVVTDQSRRRRAVIYLRESVAGEQKVSLPVQEREGRRHCDRKGYDVVAVEDDSGRSAFSTEWTERPGVVATVETVERGDADVVVVYWMSRLSRDPDLVDFAVIARRVSRAGGSIDSVTEGDNPLMQKLMAVLAGEDSRTKSTTWKAIKDRRVNELGLTHGGPARFGYVAAELSSQPPTPDPTLGPLLASMYDWYLGGAGPQSVARRLNANGLRTPQGAPFSTVGVARILDSGFAAGYLHVDTKTGAPRYVKGTHESVISEETWVSYRRERERRRRVHPKSRQPKWHLGGGLALCDECDGNLIVSTYRDPARSQARCSTHVRGGPCPGASIQRRKLDTVVALWLGARVSQWADVASERRGNDAERDRIVKELARLQTDEDKLLRGRSNATRLLTLGELNREDYRAAKREADQALAGVAEHVAELRARLDALDPDLDVYERLVRDTEGLTPEEWNVQLRRILRAVRLGRDHVTIVPWHGEPSRYARSRSRWSL